MMTKPLIIGIAGGTGSGKTTLADNLVGEFGDKIALLRHDDYYKKQDALTFEERSSLNYDHPDAFDNELLIEHIKALSSGEAIDSPIYDYKIHNRSECTRRVMPRSVILIEGILIFTAEALRELIDLKIFVDTPADVRIIRRIMRDVKERARTLESVVGQYLNQVKPMHDAFVEPSKKYADIIVPEGGKNQVAFSMIAGKIAVHLSNRD